MIDIHDAVAANAYRTKLPYPERPRKPAILSKKVGELTDDELASVADARKQFAAAMQEWEKVTEAHAADNRRLDAQFWCDLHTHYGVSGDDPFVQAMDALALEKGHSHGYSEIVCYWDDYMRFYSLYAAAKGAKQ